MLVIRNLWKNKEKIIIKRRIKTKTVYVAYPDDWNVRVSNCIKIFDKQHFVFIFQEDAKVIKKANIIEVGKVIYNIWNYCKIKITEDSIEQKHLVNGSIWKTEITALKKS